MFNSALKILTGLGIAMIGFWIVVVSALALLDRQVFDLPNHKLIIANQGLHFYSKTKTYEFKAEE